MNEVLIQSIGFVALGVNILAASSVNGNRMRALICVSCFISSIQFILLRAVVTGFNLFVNFSRVSASVKFKGIKVFFIFFVIQVLISSYYYSGPRYSLPTIASVISCYALFSAHVMRMRVAFFNFTLIRETNCFFVSSYSGLFKNLFNFIIIRNTFFRLNNKKF
ncbi:inner membrane protein [Vibrio sp. ES.051]|nr:inner membrane protein [Vibrio sp. ES.051]